MLITKWGNINDEIEEISHRIKTLIFGTVVVMLTMVAFILNNYIEYNRLMKYTDNFMVTVEPNTTTYKSLQPVSWTDCFSPKEIDALLKVGNFHSSYTPFSEKFVGAFQSVKLPVVHKFKHYTYVKMPAFEGSDAEGNRYALRVAKALIGTKGSIIIDLRGNYGGYREPMLLGVSPILNDGTLFSEKYKDGHTNELLLNGNRLKYRNTPGKGLNLLNDQTQMSDLPKKKNLNSKIYVLIDKGTASAGEHTVLALKNNRNTTVIGGKTFGATSVNGGGYYSISGSLFPQFATITEAWLQTNDGHVYKNQPISPDKFVKCDAYNAARKLINENLSTR